MERELPDCVVHKLRLLATMFDDRMGAYALLEKTVTFYFLPEDQLIMELHTRPKGKDKFEFDTFFQAHARLLAIRRQKGEPSPLSILRDALDDSPTVFAPLPLPPPPNLDTIERRRDPHGSARAYGGHWRND